MRRGRGECDGVRKSGRKNVKRWEGVEDGRDVMRNGRTNVRRREEWEGFAHRFNIAAGFSPGKKGKY